jgi:hypothetical protein
MEEARPLASFNTALGGRRKIERIREPHARGRVIYGLVAREHDDLAEMIRRQPLPKPGPRGPHRVMQNAVGGVRAGC